MKMNKILGMVGVMLLSASLSIAQTPDNANSDQGNETATTQKADHNNRGHDWDWLGLFGLVGLSGLLGSRRYTTDTMDTATEKDRGVTNIRRAA